MKKRIYTLIFTLVFICFISITIYQQTCIKTVDFNKQADKNAQKILYNYILNENKNNKQMLEYIKKSGINMSQAFFVDLNDDGENEIVGHFYGSLYSGTLGQSLFILEKQNGKYKEISSRYFNILKPVKILRNKTNGYHDLKLHGTKYEGAKTVKYNKHYKTY